MTAPGTPDTSPRADRVARAVVGLMSVVLLLLLGRVVQLQAGPSHQLRDQMQPRITRTTLLAGRGDVTDRLGRTMATSQFGFQAFVDPAEMEDPPDEEIIRLAEILRVPVEPLGERLIGVIAENRRRAALSGAPEESPSAPKAGLRSVLSAIFASSEPEGNEETEEFPTSPEDPDLVPRAPIRYVRISGILSDETVEALRRAKLKGVHLEQRGVRQYPADGLAAPIVGKVGFGSDGILGAEQAHEEELSGDAGRINYVRDAWNRPLWMSPGSFEPARRGEDVRLSIDLEIQRITTEELRRGVNDSDAAGGRAVVMDPATGEILAMVDLVRPVADAVEFPWVDAAPSASGRPRNTDLLYEPPSGAAAPRQRYITLKPDLGRLVHPALARNRCVEDVYEPGSTFKPFVWATITELGVAKLSEVFDTEGGHWRTSYGRWIRDVIRRPTMTWSEVLMYSSNIGMSKGGERLTHDQLSAAVRRFGFGSRTNIGLQGETAGLVTPRRNWSKYTQTSVCFGQEIAVTPVQMARAFCVFARNDDLAGTLPQARLTGTDDGTPPMLHRVLKPEVCHTVRTILHEIAASMEAKMASHREHPETGWRYGIFGKSGTAEIPLGKAPKGKRRPPGNKGYYERQYNASFIAAGPIQRPRLVVIVVIDDPGPERVRSNTYYGALTAGPVVRRVMERSLSYLGVPPSPAPARGAAQAHAPMAD